MSSNQPVKKPIEILFSYAREDEKLRDELEKGLSVLKRQNRIVCWHDRQISGGDPWEQAISSHLDTVDIILLLGGEVALNQLVDTVQGDELARLGIGQPRAGTDEHLVGLLDDGAVAAAVVAGCAGD